MGETRLGAAESQAGSLLALEGGSILLDDPGVC